MTKRWKSKTSSFNVLLVLITLLLVSSERTAADIVADDSGHQTRLYVGNEQIAHYFFGSRVGDDSFVLEDVRRCLDNFQLFTCMKMLLLSRINEVEGLMEDPSVGQRDLQALGGLLTFKVKNATVNAVPNGTNPVPSLDEEIANKVQRIFSKRSLMINVLPKMKIEIEPSRSPKDNFLCFRYAVHRDEEQSGKGGAIEGRKKKGGMPMMMIVPPLIMLGLMPFTLASLKAMVMNAVMINMMALNGAIFMTIRNLVFGPRRGDNVKYVNYGYSKDRQTQSRRPVLIIHSPAAFVKQPPVHRHGRPTQSHALAGHHHADSVDDEGNEYYFTREGEYGHGSGNGSREVRRRTRIRIRRY